MNELESRQTLDVVTEEVAWPASAAVTQILNRCLDHRQSGSICNSQPDPFAHSAGCLLSCPRDEQRESTRWWH